MKRKGQIMVNSPSEYLERYKEGYRPLDILLDDFFNGDLLSFLKGSSETDLDSLFLLGNAYYYGVGCEVDKDKAFKIIYPLAVKGMVSAERLLGYFYLTNGNEEEKARSEYWFNKAAEAGDDESLLYLGIFYFDKDNPRKDFKKGFSYFEKASNNGDSDATLILGCCYDDGDYVKEDLPKAFSFFSLSAKYGNTRALGYMGVFYLMGRGIEKDEKKAVELLKESAKAGSDHAMNYLGVCYDRGLGGLPVDHTIRNEWWMKALELGNKESYYMMGLVYMNGDHVETDKSKAFSYFLKAASLGDIDAEFEAGRCLIEGIGTDVDMKQGRSLMEASAKEGNNMAARYIEGHPYIFSFRP